MKRKSVSIEQMRELDKVASVRHKIPGLILMENAGISVAQAIKRQFANNSKGKSIIIFCGSGNNGGDGFVIARHLYNAGCTVEIIFTGKIEKIRGDALINWEILQTLNIPVHPADSNLETVKELCQKSDLIVDAILGVGLRTKIEGRLYNLIEVINSSRKDVIAVDIPTGLNADTGEVQGIAIQAKQTITMGAIKTGMLQKTAEKFLGEVIVGDISFPPELYKQ